MTFQWRGSVWGITQQLFDGLVGDMLTIWNGVSRVRIHPAVYYPFLLVFIIAVLSSHIWSCIRFRRRGRESRSIAPTAQRPKASWIAACHREVTAIALCTHGGRQSTRGQAHCIVGRRLLVGLDELYISVRPPSGPPSRACSTQAVCQFEHVCPDATPLLIFIL